MEEVEEMQMLTGVVEREEPAAGGGSVMEGSRPLPLELLEREIGELAAHIHAATCRWLLLIAEFDRREGWAEWGCRSCADWLSLRCALAPGPAREHVRVARRLEALPLVCEAFASGELSYSKVRAITRVADAAAEAELLELARHATAAQLERLVRAYRGVVSAQVEQANSSYEERFLSWSWDDDGSLVFHGRLPAEDGALFVRALEAGRDEVRVPAETSDGDADPESHGQAPCHDGVSADTSSLGRSERTSATNADALSLMAETLLAGGPAQRPAGERYQLVVNVDASELGGHGPGGRCELEHGPPLPAETARRMACDASVVPIAMRDGRPLTVGRRTRSIPPALRRALRTRDGGCCFPGCTQRRFVDAHHIHHWAHGGETKLSNLLLLCRRHHRLVHEGGFTVERQPEGRTVFRRPDGRIVPGSPMTQRGDCEEVRRLPGRGRSVGPDTCAAMSGGARLDCDMAVERLLVSAGLLGSPGPGVSAETPYGPRPVSAPAV